jgi:SNF2 family DNA or RNA helicase
MLNPTLKLDDVYGTPIFTLQGAPPTVKSVYGAIFNGPTKSWRFPAFYPVHQIVLGDLKKALPSLVLSPEVNAHVQRLEQLRSLPDDFSFITPPYQHQRDGLLHLYRYIRAGLFYSPGLGKCKITVDLQRLTGDKLLILCPLVMLGTWAEEFEKHGNIRDVLIIDGSKKEKLARIAKAQAQAPTATIVTYTVASLYTDDLLKIGYNAIFADESHQLKTRFSNRTKAATALAARAYRRVLLSGTPSLGSPFDMYGQLRFLGTYFCPEDWWKFRKMFGVFPDHEKDEAVPKMLLGFKNLDIMNDRVRLICLRKTKEECLDLPDQQIIDEVFPISHEQKIAYNDVVRDKAYGAGLALRENILEGSLSFEQGTTVAPHVLADEPIVVLGKVDQISSGFINLTTDNPALCTKCPHVHDCVAKEIKPYTQFCHIVKNRAPVVTHRFKHNSRLEHCTGLLETILEEPENKVIIWANYHPELDDLEKAVSGLGYGYVRVHGGFTREKLQQCMHKLNNDPDCRVYIGQVSTGIGVTLNAANYTIYYNLPWSLDHYLQSLDRNYRIGQKRKVTVYRLVARHTLDEAKVKAVDLKMDFSKLVTTTNPLCATCPDFYKRCQKYNIKLYDPDCKYDRTMLRHISSVRPIP